MNEGHIWLIRGGSAGQANALFLERNVIALNWREIGDLSEIPPDRDDFYRRVGEAYPDRGSGAHRNASGQLFRFVHEMNVNDLALYPSRIDGRFHIGRITGDYVHDGSINPDFPNRRPVIWLGAVPRERFSPRALAEMGSIMTLFQVRRCAGEVWAVVTDLASESE